MRAALGKQATFASDGNFQSVDPAFKRTEIIRLIKEALILGIYGI